MPLQPLQDFNAVYLDAPNTGIPNNQDVPKELDIFYRNESFFLPEGKTFDDLTELERKELRRRYRFDPLRPGIYQGITGIGGM